MGNTSSTEALPQEEAPAPNPGGDSSSPGGEFNTLLGKLRDIPRAAAITEGKTRTRGAGRPPNTVAADQADYGYIQVREYSSVPDVRRCTGLGLT